MPVDKSLKKVMIIGSGPIVIGQAAEFDYAGTQACKAIREEGIETVLVNSNPATIMTDGDIADKVYIEPLNVECITKIIEKEKPDGLLAGFGGQTALNLAMKLNDSEVLKKNGVKLLGINSEAIKKAEDREEFKELMLSIGEPVAKSIIATEVSQCEEFVGKHGFPVIIRPAYTLGGSGGGIATNTKELRDICSRGINLSPIGQILLEQSVAGWKEIEYEVIRDSKDNCIIVCNMENIDPVGIHTGDSIVVAPSQTLRDKEYHMLRRSAIKIIRNLKIEGGCNVQFALDTDSSNYIVIEVNPRVSRSSALASKAAGYPIAKISTKIALGCSLDELKNYVTQNSSACFEPSLDYIVVKMPKLPFDKFIKSRRTLGTQMKATGEVMSIDRTFESALLKAVTCLEGSLTGLRLKKFEDYNVNEIISKIQNQDDERIFAISEAFRMGIDIEEIYKLTKIDRWFLNGIRNIVDMEYALKNELLNTAVLKKAEAMGFTDAQICKLTGYNMKVLDDFKAEANIYPVYKMVDTCSAEFESKTPYYYSCYEEEDENIITENKKIVVIGSGPIRIGQGIEFDYSCVHGVWAIRDLGYESIIINNNPETVSTDFDTADKLYFESLYIDDVMNVIRNEKPEGVVVQFGGQTSINLAKKLDERGVNILGTSFNSIDLAEDRDKFRLLLEELNIPVPKGRSVTSIKEALQSIKELGYPVIVRPSYVIGGRAMQIVYDDDALINYMGEAVNLSHEYPVLMDKYIRGIEIEVDAVCDGESILIPGIMQHVERTGVHSGDSITIYPYITLDEATVAKLVNFTERIAKALKVIGLVNIQYVFDGSEVYVIEVNPRASRTVPILSKVTGVPMVSLAVQAMLGVKLNKTGLMERKNLYAVKVPVFSGEKFDDVDTFLGPEMKSTGEVLGLDRELDKAIYKGFSASGVSIPLKGGIYVSLKDVDKEESLNIVKRYVDMGFTIYASKGTGDFLAKNCIQNETISLNEVLQLISTEHINIVINTPTKGNDTSSEAFRIRRKAAEYRVPVFTCLDTVEAFLTAIDVKKSGKEIEYNTLNYYLN